MPKAFEEELKLPESIFDDRVQTIAQEQPKEVAPVAEPTPQTVVEKIKVGDREYDPEELSKLVGLGSTALEMEGRYHTSFPNAWSQYGKTVNENTTLKKELDDVKKQISELNKQPQSPDNEQAIKEAREQARKLGIVLKEDLDQELPTRLEQYYQQRKQQDDAGQALLAQARDLEKKMDGSDGKPAFKMMDVLEYMKSEADNGRKNVTLERAYKEINEDALEAWRDSKFETLRKPGVATTTKSSQAGVSKQPPAVKITNDNLQQLVGEQLFENNE